MSKELGRNAQCLCGSGNKYKKCCLNNKPTKNTEKAAQICAGCLKRGRTFIKTWDGFFVHPRCEDKYVQTLTNLKIGRYGNTA